MMYGDLIMPPRHIRLFGHVYVLVAAPGSDALRAPETDGATTDRFFTERRKKTLGLLERLKVHHGRKADEYVRPLQKNPKDALSYRSWREHKRLERLFKHLLAWAGEHSSEQDVAKLRKYLKAMRDKTSFTDHWEGLKKHDLQGVEAIPDDVQWPTAENSFPVAPLSPVPSQTLQRPVR